MQRIVGDLILELQDSFTAPQSRLQFFQVKRFGQIIVRARFEAFDHVPFGCPRCQQNNVDVGIFRMPADLAAYLESVQPWHEPVQKRQTRSGFAGKIFQSHASVLDGYNFIASLLQRFLQETPCKRVIVGDEDSHGSAFFVL